MEKDAEAVRKAAYSLAVVLRDKLKERVDTSSSRDGFKQILKYYEKGLEFAAAGDDALHVGREDDAIDLYVQAKRQIGTALYFARRLWP